MSGELIKTFEVELTNFCNAKCLFCPRDKLSRPKGFLDQPTFDAIIRQAKEFQISQIIFSGFGEPFLHPHILQLAEQVNQQLPEVSLDIITNGSLLAPDKIAALKKLRIGQMVISFNGFDKESYEQQMIGLNFEQIIANLRYLVQHGGPLLEKIQLRPVITKNFDLPQIKQMVNMLAKLGFRDENLNECVLCANRGGHQTDEEVCDRDFLIRRGVKFEKPEQSICLRMIKTLQLAWNGDIQLCCYDMNNEAEIGNIRTSSKTQIIKQILHYRLLGDAFPLCARCDAPYIHKTFGVLGKNDK